MATSTCKAKNPATCPHHGNPQVAQINTLTQKINAILEPKAETHTTPSGTEYTMTSRPGYGHEAPPMYTITIPAKGKSEQVQMWDNGYYMCRGERYGKTLDDAADMINILS